MVKEDLDINDEGDSSEIQNVEGPCPKCNGTMKMTGEWIDYD